MSIPYTRLEMDCRFRDDWVQPPFLGSAFRGLFGRALKDAVCVVRHRECARCLVRHDCAYTRIFETMAPAAADSPGEPAAERALPHPFILEPPDPLPASVQRSADDTLKVGLVLLGPAIASFPFVILALQRMEETGLFRARRPFTLLSVRQQGGRLLYSAERPDTILRPTPTVLSCRACPPAGNGRVEVRLLTPLRIRIQGQLKNQFDPAEFGRSLLRRAQLLERSYGTEPFSREEYRSLLSCWSEASLVSSETRWYDWRRYSNRQGTSMQLGGLLGRVVLHLDWNRLGPLLSAATVLHVGKATSFGLGRCEAVTRC